MIDYKKHIDEYKDFPIDGINYLDLNPLYKNSSYRYQLVNDCLELTKKFN